MQQTEFEYHTSYVGFDCSSTGYFVPYRRSQVGASSYHFAILITIPLLLPLQALRWPQGHSVLLHECRSRDRNL